MVKRGELVKVGTGLYMRSDAWEDEIYLLQRRFKKGILSHETALYLHGFTDRTPAKFTMTFPYGYKTALLEKEPIHTKRVMKEKYGIGIVEVETPCKNTVRVYDIERTLCDVVKGRGCDVQIVKEAMKRYARMSGKDMHKLMEYAEIMRVKPKILKYMEVLL
jgi:predicted transcriptional regulator of viral defense system